MVALGTIPEAVEYDVLASLEARTASLSSFRELGPIDLVQLTKLRQGTETSTYHNVSGINVSSSAAAAAYINTLTFSLGDGQNWFGSTRHWKIINGTYCCWNAFSKVDVRVKAAIPGGVEEYVVSVGDQVKQSVSEVCWLETYMSSMVRSLIYADDDAFYLKVSRRNDPFATVADFKQFLYAFEALFGLGPQLGSCPKFQLSSLTANYMVDAFFVACQITQRWEDAKECLERIAKRVPQAKDLLVRLNLLSNHEIDAVELMVNIVEENPRNGEMLAQEAAFCLSKGNSELAYDCAVRAAAASPGQFFSWEMLAKVYVEQGKYADALLALNSRPMVSRPPMDSVTFAAPRKVHSPLPMDGKIEDIWAINTSEVEMIDPNLMKLTGGTLKGGSKWAYDIVARIYAKIGWPELMKIRGDIFLMEAEASKEPASAVVVTAAQEPAKPDAESDIGPDDAAHQTAKDSSGPQDDQETVAQEATLAEDEIAKEEPSTSAPAPAQTAADISSTIKTKRLCERRLDLLFMTLWEDARAHSHWQREAVHFESAQTSYTKTASEWEILGCVAQRLHYDDQAMAAFEKSLALKFSHRVAFHMLDYYAAPEGKYRNTSLALQLMVKLYAWNHRWYIEFSPRLRIILNKIVASEGTLKVLTEVQTCFSGEGVVTLIEQEIAKIKAFSA